MMSSLEYFLKHAWVSGKFLANRGNILTSAPEKLNAVSAVVVLLFVWGCYQGRYHYYHQPIFLVVSTQNNLPYPNFDFLLPQKLILSSTPSTFEFLTATYCRLNPE